MPATHTPAPLPERDDSKPADAQGLFLKFDVRRTDGSDAPGEKHHGCRYFVLDADHDAYTPAALGAYAAACAETHPQLAADLVNKWGAVPASLRDAAPDLLAALQEIAEIERTAWSVKKATEGMNRVGEIARAAIAKATAQ